MLTVTYNGGVLLAHVELQPVFIGSDWNTNPTLVAQRTQLNQFASMIVQSSYIDMIAQNYSTGTYQFKHGTASPGVVDAISINKLAGITDLQIQAQIQQLINQGRLQAPDANRLYMVYVEPGVDILTDFGSSSTAFLGYHSAFAGTTATHIPIDVHYGVIAYPGPPNFTSSSQLFPSDLDQMTAVSSHELAEAMTDANVNYKTLGWYDFDINGEVADIPLDLGLLPPEFTTQLNGFLVQDLVDQHDNLIVPVSTFQAPQNVAVKALNQTQAQLTWSPSFGATGYSIFLVNGNQRQLLANLGSGATSFVANNLTPGATESFIVEAVAPGQTADSSVVSVTMPVSLAAPVVQAQATSSTTGLLSWQPVTNAQGYRVFELVNGQKVLLSTLAASTSTIQLQIVGLTPNTTTQFVVEAYHGSTTADSQTAFITTPPAVQGASVLEAVKRLSGSVS